jgi:hypothetical protein
MTAVAEEKHTYRCHYLSTSHNLLICPACLPIKCTEVPPLHDRITWATNVQDLIWYRLWQAAEAFPPADKICLPENPSKRPGMT